MILYSPYLKHKADTWQICFYFVELYLELTNMLKDTSKDIIIQVFQITL